MLQMKIHCLCQYNLKVKQTYLSDVCLTSIDIRRGPRELIPQYHCYQVNTIQLFSTHYSPLLGSLTPADKLTIRSKLTGRHGLLIANQSKGTQRVTSQPCFTDALNMLLVELEHLQRLSFSFKSCARWQFLFNTVLIQVYSLLIRAISWCLYTKITIG